MFAHVRGPGAVAAVAALVAGGVTGCAAGSSRPAALTAAAAADRAVLTAKPGSCVGPWRPGAAGPHTFTVANHTGTTVQIAFIDATSGSIFGQISQLDPGTTRPLAVDPPAGSYRFRCIPRRGDATVSPVGRLTGPGGSSAAALSPLSAEEIVSAVADYRRGVHHGIAALTNDTDRLQLAVGHSNWPLARRRWLTAHLDFARLGAAYGTFGDLSDAIDGRSDGLPRGVHDPGFTGFLAVERLLWHHPSAADVRPAVGTLDHDVRTLARRFPKLTLVAGDLPLRAHEILENALQFELTGDTDEGSHTNLATVLANVQGTMAVIRALTPALQQRLPDLLTMINTELRGFATDLRSTRSMSGHWPNVATLPRPEHERLDAAIDGLLEHLSLLPGVLTLPVSLALP